MKRLLSVVTKPFGLDFDLCSAAGLHEQGPANETNRQIGISSTEIRADTTGTFLIQFKRERVPAVMVLGGSEGGVPRALAALIASHRYAALAVAYLAMDGLPRDLEQVPAETVDRAVEWRAKNQRSIRVASQLLASRKARG